jgi:hypothetical protein
VQNETYYFAYSASLRIFGDIPNLNDISLALGLQPTHTHKKGETGRGSVCHKQDMWAYDPPVDKAEPLHKHIDELWARVRPHKDYLLELKKSLTVDVFLGYRSDCETAGVEVPHTSLEMFTELQVSLGLSIIVA